MAEAPKGYCDVLTDDGRTLPLKIETHTIIERERLAANIRENLKRSLPRFRAHPHRPEPLAIVAAGPSVRDKLDDIRSFEHILACGSAHDYLVSSGIVPTYALVADAGSEDWKNLSLANGHTTFIIASQCDKSLFEHLEGHKVEMWHYRGQAAATKEEEYELLNGEHALGWGSTVGIIATHIALYLGFQHHHRFGLDSCYGDNGLAHHCAPIHGSLEYQKVPVTLGPEKKTYITDLGLIEQANQFFRLLDVDGQYFHSYFHGDGLIAAMARYGDHEMAKYVTLCE